MRNAPAIFNTGEKKPTHRVLRRTRMSNHSASRSPIVTMMQTLTSSSSSSSVKPPAYGEDEDTFGPSSASKMQTIKTPSGTKKSTNATELAETPTSSAQFKIVNE